MRDQFLSGAEVVLEAVTDPRVVEAWDQPSILEDQSVGSVAGHLARGSVSVVHDYLSAASPGTIESTPIDCETAAGYYAAVADSLTAEDHVKIRERGAQLGSVGPEAVGDQLRMKLAELRIMLADAPALRLVSVYGGTIMRLDDYLFSRIVEQVVHLDDLARSVGVEPWTNPPDAEALVLSCGAEIGRLRYGGAAMIRALYRGEHAGGIPVL